MATNDGKLLESAVYAALFNHQHKHKSHFVRFFDQTSFGGRGHRLPGDFLWLLPNKAVLIECKSTVGAKNLVQLIKSTKKSVDQLPRHTLWHIAKHPSLYIYYSAEAAKVSAYCGESVIRAVRAKNFTLLVELGCSGLRGVPQLLEAIALQFRECQND